MLLWRILSSLAGIPLLIFVVIQGQWWLFGALLVVALVAQREFLMLATGLSSDVLHWVGYLGTFLVLFFVVRGWLATVGHLVVALAFTMLIIQLGRRPREESVTNIAVAMLSIVYPGLFFSYILLLRDLGIMHLLVVFTATWAFDTCAYFSGRALGRRKLFPAVSPNKTIEGAVGGLVASTLLTPLFAPALGVSPLILAFFGLVLGCAAQAGDLAESLLKRVAGAKDSGTLIPGHGGVLDRFDGILFTVPLSYWFFNFLL